MIYVATLSEPQRVMLWRLILDKFGPNIQHRAVVDNIVSDTLSRLSSLLSNSYEPCTRKSEYHTNELFAIGEVLNNEDFHRQISEFYKENNKINQKI